MAIPRLYELLLDYAEIAVDVEEVVLGLRWILCRAGSCGVAATPSMAVTGNGWGLPLRGRSLAELSRWLLEWQRDKAAIGLAAVNAAINREADLVTQQGAIFQGRDALHHAFGWFAPQLEGQRVALIGDASLPQGLLGDCELWHLPQHNGALHPACESELADSDWCFINSTTIADKTLPRVLELAADSRIVLYGPSLPWLEEWREFGVDYLLGCEVDAPEKLLTTVQEGGDIERDPLALHYRLINLHTQHVIPAAVETWRHAASA